MFTGLIEGRGTLTGTHPVSGGLRLEIDLGPLADTVRIGDSIAVNGSCLTVAALADTRAVFDVSAESLRVTTMASWRNGRLVNLERALALGDRLGGHFVAGHVDGIGRLQSRRPRGNSTVFTFLLPDHGSVRVVEKGSVAIDGISLTSYDCRGRRFSVSVIPHTARETTLGLLRPGGLVHLEQDLLGRWATDPGRR